MPAPSMALRDLRAGGVTMTSLTAGLPARADDDLFPALDGGDELGEVRLGVTDVDFHAALRA